MRYCPNCGTKLEADGLTEPKTPYNAPHEVTEALSEYLGQSGRVAIPKVSNYREKYKAHKLTSRDVQAGATKVPVIQPDAELSRFGGLVVGPGVEQEY